MPNKEPYPKPKAGPRKAKPRPTKGPRMDRDLREMPKRTGKYEMAPLEKREMPKRLGLDPWGDKTRKDMEMPKIMGSTKAQRADSAREMMDNMRSRNLLRSRNLSRKPKKRGM